MGNYSFDNLTNSQKRKWRHFLEENPEFSSYPAEKSFTSVELGGLLLSDSNKVSRDLQRIGKRLGCKLRTQLMMRHRNGFFPATSDDLRKMKRTKGSDNKGWFKDHRFEGTSQWIKLSLTE